MTFDEALKKLGIKEYKLRIFYSNSHGELSHLYDYIYLAERLPKEFIKDGMFKEWFEFTVKYAEENWKRPEAIFQYIITAYNEFIEYIQKN